MCVAAESLCKDKKWLVRIAKLSLMDAPGTRAGLFLGLYQEGQRNPKLN